MRDDATGAIVITGSMSGSIGSGRGAPTTANAGVGFGGGDDATFSAAPQRRHSVQAEGTR
jgi:hypothetical protein